MKVLENEYNITSLDELMNSEKGHNYIVNNVICTSNCDVRALAEQYFSNPAPADYPFGAKSGPVETGDTTFVLEMVPSSNLKEFLTNFSVLPGGPVEHLVDSNSNTFGNMTQKGHVLHPGYIVRSLRSNPDGSVSSITIGRGVGGFPRLNERIGSGIFTRQDNQTFGTDYNSGGYWRMPR